MKGSAGLFAYFFNQKNEVVVAKINDQKIFKSDIEKKLKDVFDEIRQNNISIN